MLFSVFRGTHTGTTPLPKWAGDVSLALEMGWTEKQLREENTLEFLEHINVYLSERSKAEKVNEMTHQSATPHVPQRSYKKGMR